MIGKNGHDVKKETEKEKNKIKIKACNTGRSRVVSDHSTLPAQRSLTAESGRDPVFSPWYDRRQPSLPAALYISHTSPSPILPAPLRNGPLLPHRASLARPIATEPLLLACLLRLFHERFPWCSPISLKMEQEPCACDVSTIVFERSMAHAADALSARVKWIQRICLKASSNCD